MPWEKSFDEDEVLRKAMLVFWEKGFESASIADLVEGTGINKGSLYNAFGGKQNLFVSALLKYDQDNHKDFLAGLEALDRPKQAITELFDRVVAETVADSEHKGCFLVNTASEIAVHDEKVSKIVTQGLRQVEAFLRRCIEVGQARDEIAKHRDPEATAKALLGLIVAIRVLGRGVFTEKALQTLADQAKRLIV